MTDFTINLASPHDFSQATITVVAYAPNARGGFIEAYLQNNGGSYAVQKLGPQPLATFALWSTYTWTVPSTFTNAFDVTQAYYLGLTIESGSATAPFEQPATVVEVGELIVGGVPGVMPFVFGKASTVSNSNASPLPRDRLWLNTYYPEADGGPNYLLFDRTCGKPGP
jgi:hypothetical protein